MIKALLWKEYRETRGTALILAIVTIGVMGGIQPLLPKGRPSDDLRVLFVGIAVWFVGLILGAQSLASEIENRTQGWLDMLPATRLRIGVGKILLPALIAMFHAMLLFAICYAMEWIPRAGAKETTTLLVGLAATLALLAGIALCGFACGVLGSSMARSPFGAVGFALLAQLATVVVSYLLIGVTHVLLPRPQWLLWEECCLFVFGLPLYFALRRYSRLDRQRRWLPEQELAKGGGWRSLIWLSWRQSRRAFWFLTLISVVVVVSLFVFGERWGEWRVFWPPLGMYLGIIAGIGTFSTDRPGDAYLFFGDRRVPYGRLWLIKVGIRFIAALMPVLFPTIILLSSLGHYRIQRALDGHETQWADLFRSGISPDLDAAFLFLGPITGFVLGVFFDFIFRKAFIAAFVAFAIALGVLIVWWPAIILGGLHTWQWIVAPIVLISATRFLTRSWVSGRLTEWRSIGVLSIAAFLALGAFGLGFWYRNAEVPMHTEPFDVAAFEKSLPKLDNLARKQVTKVLESQPNHLWDQSSTPAENLWRDPLRDLLYADPDSHQQALRDHVTRLRDSDAKLGNWIDTVVGHPWFGKLREAVKAPLGMLTVTGTSSHGISLQTVGGIDLGDILKVRILFLATHDRPEEAFEAFFLALDLSRHLRSHAPASLYYSGARLESSALEILPTLIIAAKSQPRLLSDALTRLQEHDKAVPSVADSIRLEYLSSRSRLMEAPLQRYGDRWHLGTHSIALNAPWEMRRALDVQATVFSGFLRAIELPYRSLKRRLDYSEFNIRDDLALLQWAPVSEDEPTAKREYRVINDLTKSVFYLYYWESARLVGEEFFGQTRRGGRLLQLALAVYQTKHGKSATALTELVPEILPSLPLDPFSGESFRYQISTGGNLARNVGDELKRDWKVNEGEGVLWSVGPDMTDNAGDVYGGGGYFIPKRAYDIVFIVPRIR